ncbi:transcriptional regulator [Olleya sp. Bg11-27]|nr:transcriptional regulator [Olleya sp. Bg11-27]
MKFNGAICTSVFIFRVEGKLPEIKPKTTANLSILKSGKAKAVRFSTLEAICIALDCQPADILEYTED